MNLACLYGGDRCPTIPKGTGLIPTIFSCVAVLSGNLRPGWPRRPLPQHKLAMRRIAFGHGVSVTSPEANRQLARDPHDAVGCTRRTFEEAGFPVVYTPTRNDVDHHTVRLPYPVTDDVARLFNTILGRTIRRRRS